MLLIVEDEYIGDYLYPYEENTFGYAAIFYGP